MDQTDLITHTAEIVAAHVANNPVAVDEIGPLVQRVHEALASLSMPKDQAPAEKVPVVSVRASIRPDHIICMECGKKQKMLRRHLQTAHGMSPDQYRKDYGLPGSYPLVAPNYSERRRGMAKSIGLGKTKPQEDAPAPATKRKRPPGEDRPAD